MDKVQGELVGKLKTGKRLSEVQIRELIRPYVPEAISTLVNLMRNGDNDNVKMGAVKVLLAKVMPDLKSSEVHGEITGKWIVSLERYGRDDRSRQIDSHSTT